jgi:hypothetical protein
VQLAPTATNSPWSGEYATDVKVDRPGEVHAGARVHDCPASLLT